MDARSLSLYRWYYSRLCQWGLGLAIAVDLLLAFVERPSSMSVSSDPRIRLPPWEPPCGFTQSIEIVCLVVFALDLAVKGYLIGWEEFRKSKWLIGYTVVITFSVMDWVLSVSMACDERFRVRRLVRPFFLLQNSSLMKKTLKCIKRTLPEIGSVFLMLALHLFLFTLIGMLLFAKTDNGQWKKYFRDLPTALTSLLVLLTTANNPDVMIPAYSLKRANAIFFMIFSMIGKQGLSSSMSVQTSIIRRRLGIRAAFQVLSCQGARQAHPPLPQYNSPVLQRIQVVFTHYFLMILGNIMALANVICICTFLVLNSEKSTTERDYYIIEIVNLCFILYYLFEMCVKIFAFGWKGYLSYRSNIFDCFLNILLLILQITILFTYRLPYSHWDPSSEGVLSLWDLLRLINMLIVFRFLRIIPDIKVHSRTHTLTRRLYVISNTSMENMASNLTMQCGTYEELGYWPNNFDDFAAAIILLYDIMVVNNWQAFLTVYNRYGTPWSKVYFVTWWLTSSVMWVNLFVAVILEVSSLRWIHAYIQTYMHTDMHTCMYEVKQIQEPTEEELLCQLNQHPHLHLHW
uniref:Two pore segment channel 2 n=1 Tax=Cyclopterus lumpus TaxID=8103 RepID=A0A8C2WAV1_CYCLU